MERTIRVTGKGKVSVKPDRIRLIITQEGVEKEYDQAITDSSNKKRELNKCFEDIGFHKADLKTLYFNVDTKYQSYKAYDNSWNKRFIGYEYTHRMKIEFDNDNTLLGQVLYQISQCSGTPEFSIEYTVSDPEAAKQELLKRSIEDSRAKALVLTSAAGVQLNEIVAIDYSWSTVDFVSHPMEDIVMKDCCRSVDLDIEADDIDITDTVTVIWSIL